MDALFVAAGLNSKGTRRRDRITLHSLRHTFASWLAIAGLPLRGIQELLGHKSILTTERYSHLGGNGMRPYYAELAKAVTGGFVIGTTAYGETTQRLGSPAASRLSSGNSVINSVISGVEDAARERPQLVEGIGGGGATRTPDLGIMSLFRPDFEDLRSVSKDFDFEEDTLP